VLADGERVDLGAADGTARAAFTGDLAFHGTHPYTWAPIAHLADHPYCRDRRRGEQVRANARA
jgi:hypothetical protein